MTTGVTRVLPDGQAEADHKLDVDLDIVCRPASAEQYRLGIAARLSHIPAPCEENTTSCFASGMLQHTSGIALLAY